VGERAATLAPYELAIAMEALGAGEILLNCIDEDGQGNGFDHELVGLVSDAVGIPVIASSGAGCPQHFTDVFNATKCSAALAAGIFHREEVLVSEVKDHMVSNGLPTRV
jgi:glutamine amidotransferase/cyclase